MRNSPGDLTAADDAENDGLVSEKDAADDVVSRSSSLLIPLTKVKEEAEKGSSGGEV